MQMGQSDITSEAQNKKQYFTTDTDGCICTESETDSPLWFT